jgi:hypothetical protein
MGELVAAVLKGVDKELAAQILRWMEPTGARLVTLFGVMVCLMEALFSKEGASRFAGRVAESIAALFVANDPQTQELLHAMGQGLIQALMTDYLVSAAALGVSIAVLIIMIGVPILYKAVTRRTLCVFVSFNRTREDIAQALEARLRAVGTRVYRIAYQEDALHQTILMQVKDGIRKCHGVVCVPGLAPSFVEHEVAAASQADKPIVFLISDDRGALPNTADKRYPVFRLETTVREKFKPLLDFLDYIGADLRSTWALCRRALFHPLLTVSARAAAIPVALSLIVLWTVSGIDVRRQGRMLASATPSFDAVAGPLIAAHICVLALLVFVVVFTGLYAVLFAVNLRRQMRARRRVTLEAVESQFGRDGWIGIVPGLVPGEPLYECLFDAAPSAHHQAAEAQHAS